MGRALFRLVSEAQRIRLEAGQDPHNFLPVCGTDERRPGSIFSVPGYKQSNT
jgi:hypothetical protein